ncbi:MAG TPA: hypothetical protein VL633_04280 [Bacteroidota bacterium]|jgi:hypothetical protein|nr:hypothetical protein [Bacteroidota bacterium]
MAAIDTYDWFVSTIIADASPEVREVIKSQRQYIFTLRSEDETQRFVDNAILELRQRLLAQS